MASIFIICKRREEAMRGGNRKGKKWERGVNAER